MSGFYVSLNALKASQNWLDRVGDNLANVDTPGFAESKASFSDALTAAWGASATGPTQASRFTPPGWNGGTGVISGSIERDFTTMPIQTTGVETDFAIDGPGFFLVQGDAGQAGAGQAGAGSATGATAAGGQAVQPLLTKAGNFGWSKDSAGGFFLATNDGRAVLDTNGSRIRAAAGNQTSPLSVGNDGSISIAGKPTGQRIAIAEVGLPSQDLQAAPGNTFALVAGGNMTVVNRGNANNSTSSIRQGALANSNVDMTQAMTEMLQAQRMFDLNSEAEQMANRMNTDANNIHS